MNTYKVWITGTYNVHTLVEAKSPAHAEQIVDEYGFERIEELIFIQGSDAVLSISSDALPEKENVGYIAQSNGNLFHRFFESRTGLIEHLRQRSNALYLGAITDDELFDFFLARNYFRVV